MEYILIGDCYLICGNEIITDTRITEFSTENRKKIQKILENVSEDELPTKRLEIFRKTRLKPNTSVGYPIGSLHFESVDNVLSGVLKGVTDFLMMSDGYYKYYDKDVTVRDTIRKIEMDSQQSLIYGKCDDVTGGLDYIENVDENIILTTVKKEIQEELGLYVISDNVKVCGLFIGLKKLQPIILCDVKLDYSFDSLVLKPNEEIKNIHITSKDCLVNYFSDYNMSEATMFHLKK